MECGYYDLTLCFLQPRTRTSTALNYDDSGNLAACAAIGILFGSYEHGRSRSF